MQQLEKTFIEEHQGAGDEFKKGRYRNSAILYAKALFALCDALIYAKLKKLPTSHSERFRILEEHFPDVYSIADEIFTHYTDTYSKPVLKETCTIIKNGIKKISSNQETPAGVKEAIE